MCADLGAVGVRFGVCLSHFHLRGLPAAAAAADAMLQSVRFKRDAAVPPMGLRDPQGGGEKKKKLGEDRRAMRRRSCWACQRGAFLRLLL